MNLLSNPLFALPVLYLDPGSGSFLIQLLLAAVLGIGVFVRMYWTKIKTLFGKKSEPTQSSEEKDEE